LKEAPEVSLVLSSYNRPELLPMSLGSIYAQSMQDFIVLVTDNALDAKTAAKHKAVVEYYAALDESEGRESRFLYERTAAKIKVSDSYWSAEWGVEHLRKLKLLGRWLSFPCDDTQYFPLHLQTMLTAAAKNLWDCVITGLPVVGPAGPTRSTAGYSLWELDGWAAKDTFLLRSKHFFGFPGKPLESMPSASDTALIQALKKQGVRVGSVLQPTMVHN